MAFFLRETIEGIESVVLLTSPSNVDNIPDFFLLHFGLLWFSVVKLLYKCYLNCALDGQRFYLQMRANIQTVKKVGKTTGQIRMKGNIKNNTL